MAVSRFILGRILNVELYHYICTKSNHPPMKKIIYFCAVLTILSASSCSKQCVQCQAKDRYGVVVNTSNVICDGNLNRKEFEKRYEADFNGYNTVCSNVNN